VKLTRVEILRESIKIVIAALSDKKIPITQAGASAFVEWHPHTGVPKRINIPYVPDNASDKLIKAVQGFVDHECAHVLFTEFEVVKAAKYAGADRAHNILEDTFIERKMKKLYAGSRHNLVEVWSFLAEEMIKPQLDRAIAEGTKSKIIGAGLSVAIHAWAGNEAAVEFMNSRWGAFAEIKEIIGDDLIEQIPNISSSKEALVVAVGIKNRMAEWKQREFDEEKKRREDERDKEESNSDEGDDSGGESGSGSGGESDSDDQSEDVGSDMPMNDEDGEEQPGDDDCPESEEPEDDPHGDKDEDGASDDSPEEEDAEEEDAEEKEAGEENDEEENDEEEDAEGPDFESTSHVKEDDEPDEEKSDDDSKTASSEEGSESSEEEGDDAPEKEDESTGGSSKDDDDAIASTGEDDDDDDAGDSESADDENDDKGAVGDSPEKSIDREVDMSDFESSVDELEKGIEAMEDMEGLTDALIAAEMEEALKHSNYWPLTKDGDRIERYTPKVTDREYVLKRQTAIQKHIGQITKNLERLIQAKSFDRKIPGFKSGKLDGASLHRVPTGDERVFRRDMKMTTKDVDVQLVIDLSGSMYGEKVELACECAYAIGTALDRLNINSQIVGFTTKGMEEITHHMTTIRKAISEDTTPKEPSRYEPIYMPIIKDWNQRFSADRKSACIMAAHDVGLANNIDGESIEYAARMLWSQPGARKLMIVLSDGSPVASGNHWELVSHLGRVIKRLIKDGTEVFGIGIMDDCVSKFYPDYVVVHKMSDLLDTVMSNLKRMLLKGQ